MDAGHRATTYGLPGAHPSTHIPPGTPQIHHPKCEKVTIRVAGTIPHVQCVTLSPDLLASLSGRAACDAIPTGITVVEVITNVLVGIDVVDHNEHSVVPAHLMQSSLSEDETSAIPAELGETTFLNNVPVRFPLVVSSFRALENASVEIPIEFDPPTKSLLGFHQTLARGLHSKQLHTGLIRREVYTHPHTRRTVSMTKAPVAHMVESVLHASLPVFVFEMRGREDGFYMDPDTKRSMYADPEYRTSTVDNHETKYLLVDPEHWEEVTDDLEERLKADPTTISIMITPIPSASHQSLARTLSVHMSFYVHFGREDLAGIYEDANLSYPGHRVHSEESQCDDEHCAEDEGAADIQVYSESEEAEEEEEEERDDAAFGESTPYLRRRKHKKHADDAFEAV